MTKKKFGKIEIFGVIVILIATGIILSGTLKLGGSISTDFCGDDILYRQGDFIIHSGYAEQCSYDGRWYDYTILSSSKYTCAVCEPWAGTKGRAFTGGINDTRYFLNGGWVYTSGCWYGSKGTKGDVILHTYYTTKAGFIDGKWVNAGTEVTEMVYSNSSSSVHVTELWKPGEVILGGIQYGYVANDASWDGISFKGTGDIVTDSITGKQYICGGEIKTQTIYISTPFTGPKQSEIISNPQYLAKDWVLLPTTTTTMPPKASCEEVGYSSVNLGNCQQFFSQQAGRSCYYCVTPTTTTTTIPDSGGGAGNVLPLIILAIIIIGAGYYLLRGKKR